MALINNPAIVNFSREQLRVAADSIETAANVVETLVARYADWQLALLLSGLSDDDVIDDKAAEEGRPVYTVGMMKKYIENCQGLLAQFNVDTGNGFTMRRQLRYMATNPKNPLLK